MFLRSVLCITVLLMGMVSSGYAATRSAVSALSLVLPEVRFDGMRFQDAVDYLRDISGANFHVNWKAIEAQNISPDSPITLRVRSVTLRKTLEMMLSDIGSSDQLAFYNDQGVIEITTKEFADRALVTRVYDIMDLMIIFPSIPRGSSNLGNNGIGNGSGSNNGGVSTSSTASRSSGIGGSSRSAGSSRSTASYSSGTSSRTGANNRTNNSTTGNNNTADIRQQMGDDLVALIMDTIEPEIWKENGGTSTIRYFREGRLIITAPRRIHERIGGAIE